MKAILFITTVIFSGILLLHTVLADGVTTTTSRPDDFIDIHQAVPQIQIDMRYYSSHNFIGKRNKVMQAEFYPTIAKKDLFDNRLYCF